MTQEDDRGSVAFASLGLGRLHAHGGQLTLSLEAPGAARLGELQDVVARHLLRFAFRAALQVDGRAD